jgi:dipeptidase D
LRKNKTKEKIIDFDSDPIELVLFEQKNKENKNEKWIKANETTLGADNSAGVALALAIADDKSIQHGDLEFLFTVEEEIGLFGALEVEKNYLKAEYMLNLDSEQIDVITTGSQGLI